MDYRLTSHDDGENIERKFSAANAEIARLTAERDTAWNDAIDAAHNAADYCRKSAFTAEMGMQPVLESILALHKDT